LSHPFGGGKGVPGGGECLAIRWPVTSEVLHDIREYGAVPDHPIWFAANATGGVPALETTH
jgi:hypothetical protein